MPFESKSKSPNMYLKHARFIGLPFRQTMSRFDFPLLIGDLEKEWKVVLLERNKSGVKLTSDGLRLLPYAKSLVTEYY